MNSRLYVGNLSYDVSSDSVRAFFRACGDVTDIHVVTDRQSGQPRGFAYVTMATEAQATGAISDLNHSMFEGRPLRVTLAEHEFRAGRRSPRR